MKKLLLGFLLMLPGTALWGQTLTYQLLSDSSIAFFSGATQTGASEPLTGSFSWTVQPGSSTPQGTDFSVTALDFDSADFSLSDTTTLWSNDTVSDGTATFNAEVTWLQAATNPYLFGSFPDGSYQGPDNAPTSLYFPSVGLSLFLPSGSSSYSAKAVIHAELVSEIPEPSTWMLLLGGQGMLFIVWRGRRLIS